MRSTIDVYDDGIARTQPIVRGRGDIHVGLETQILVVEDVVTENLGFLFLLLFQQTVEHLDGIYRQQAAHLLLHHQEVLVGLADVTVDSASQPLRAVGADSFILGAVSFVSLLALAVLLTQTVGRRAGSGFFDGAQPRVVVLTFVFAAYTLYLLHVHTTLHQFL